MTAGTAKIDITPDRNVWMDGMIREHRSEGVHDSLFARALVLANDEDISNIYEQARILGADMILSTEKDWVKSTLYADKNEEILFAYLGLELQFVEGADEIETLVKKVLS